ncbi:hypothetical protein [Helicobacter mehlei]|nr:hypothetical protein [Helicobacter mehlei]
MVLKICAEVLACVVEKHLPFEDFSIGFTGNPTHMKVFFGSTSPMSIHTLTGVVAGFVRARLGHN